MNELPQGWVYCQFSDVLESIVGGGTPSKANPEYFAGSIPFMTVKDLHERFPRDTIDHISEDAVSDSATSIVPKDTLIVATRMSLGKIARPKFRTAFNQDLKALLLVDGIDKTYVEYWWRSQSTHIQSLGTGTTVKGIRLEDIKGLEFPVAPSAEQKRIANKLDALLARVDATRDRLDRIPTLLKRFRQSVLAAAFTGRLTEGFCGRNRFTPVNEMIDSIAVPPRPNRFSSRTEEVMDGDYALAVGNPSREIPNEWRWIPLVDIARMESGHTPSRSHPEYWGGKIDWVGIADARDWHGKTIPETHQKTNKLGIQNSAARLLPKDTICLSRTASVGYVVRMGKPMATSQDFANWTCTDAINPDWLKYLFMAETEAIYRFGKGSTHTTVYFPELMAFHVALPPIEEQKEIVRRVEALFALADKVEARYTSARAQVDKLTPALLAKAFRGELVEQDPSDEPAEQLLARLRATKDTTTRAKRGRKSRENREKA